MKLSRWYPRPLPTMRNALRCVLIGAVVAMMGQANATPSTQDAANWLNGKKFLLSWLYFQNIRVTDFVVFPSSCSFELSASSYHPGVNPVLYRLNGSLRDTMMVVSGAGPSVLQIYSPRGETIRQELSGGGGGPPNYSNKYVLPLGVKDVALGQQFLNVYNFVSSACGGPGGSPDIAAKAAEAIAQEQQRLANEQAQRNQMSIQSRRFVDAARATGIVGNWAQSEYSLRNCGTIYHRIDVSSDGIIQDVLVPANMTVAFYIVSVSGNVITVTQTWGGVARFTVAGNRLYLRGQLVPASADGKADYFRCP